jgi:hypothetical protein
MNSGGFTTTVKSQYRHPQYNDNTLNYDYLLIMLATPVDTNTYPTIQLNSDTNEPVAGDLLTVIGFGTTSENGSQSNRLQKVQVPALAHSVCNTQYPGVNANLNFCAGYTQGKIINKNS